MKKILLLSSSYLPVLGGLQTLTHNLAIGLQQKGHSIQVITSRFPRALLARQHIDQISIFRLNFLMPDFNDIKRNRLDLFLASFYFFPATMLQLIAFIYSFRPDVVNVHYPLYQIPFVLELRKRFQFRLVVSLHGDDLLPSVNTGIDYSGLRDILKKADAITACSRWMLNKAIDWEPTVKGKGIAIHNGIDPIRFLDKAIYSYPARYIFAFGRLSFQKGFDLLIDAFLSIAQ